MSVERHSLRDWKSGPPIFRLFVRHTVDQSIGSVLGHSAHYVCSNCGSKKMSSGSSNSSSAGNNSISHHCKSQHHAAASTKNPKSRTWSVVKQWSLILLLLPPNHWKNQALVVGLPRMVTVLFQPPTLLRNLEWATVNLLQPPNLLGNLARMLLINH